MARAQQLIGTGEIIDIYSIIKELPKKGKHRIFEVKCTLCDQGSTVYLSNMRRGANGCIHCRSRITGDGLATKDENGRRNPLYDKWFRVKARCYDPNHKSYADYGGRGIEMSKEFLEDKRAFIEYLANLDNYGVEGYDSLDRRNNEGHYERGNLRWATRTMQNNNKRSNL